MGVGHRHHELASALRHVARLEHRHSSRLSHWHCGLADLRLAAAVGCLRGLFPMTSTPIYALRGLSVRRTPRACHGACARLRPGRLRASHAVCLRYSTLEPVICARNEEADNESLSTNERIRTQPFAMRSLNTSFWTDSLRSSSASSMDFSDSLPHPLRSEETPNNGAAANCYGRGWLSRWLLPAEPATQPARQPAPPSAVAELESLGDFAHLSRAMSASESIPSLMPSTDSR